MNSSSITETSPAGVSVIIPAYNYGRFLPKAIDSVLAQDYPHYEIIVVDDGSTDNTAEIVAGYGSKVRYIHKKNGGLPAARNTGIKAATYPFVGFLDADDEWLPSRLSEAMKRFAELPADFAISACKSIPIDAEGREIPIKFLTRSDIHEVTCKDILLKTQFSPSSVIAKRAAVEASGYFNESLRSSEDRDMWIRMTARYRAILNGQRLIKGRRHSNNMSSHSDRMRENTRRVLRESFQNGYVSRINVFFWMRVFSFNHFETAWMYWSEGRRGEAVREMSLSLLKWPFFYAPKNLNEPVLFRVRALGRMLLMENPRRAAVQLQQAS